MTIDDVEWKKHAKKRSNHIREKSSNRAMRTENQFKIDKSRVKKVDQTSCYEYNYLEKCNVQEKGKVKTIEKKEREK